MLLCPFEGVKKLRERIHVLVRHVSRVLIHVRCYSFYTSFACLLISHFHFELISRPMLVSLVVLWILSAGVCSRHQLIYYNHKIKVAASVTTSHRAAPSIRSLTFMLVLSSASSSFSEKLSLITLLLTTRL